MLSTVSRHLVTSRGSTLVRPRTALPSLVLRLIPRSPRCKHLCAPCAFSSSGLPTASEVARRESATHNDVSRGDVSHCDARECDDVGHSDVTPSHRKRIDGEKKKQETSVPQGGRQETSVPQGGRQETSVPQGGRQETSVPQGGRQETSVPQGGRQETSVPQGGRQETSVLQSNRQETGVHQSGEGGSDEVINCQSVDSRHANKTEYLHNMLISEHFQNQRQNVNERRVTEGRDSSGDHDTAGARSWEDVVDGVTSLLKRSEEDIYEERTNRSPEYFRYLVESVKYRSDDVIGAQSVLKSAQLALPYGTTASGQVRQADDQSVSFEFDPKELAQIRPLAPARSAGLAAYVNYSVTLQRLVTLGVNLYAIGGDKQLAGAILRMDFKSDLLPRLHFLKELGLRLDKVADVLNNAPHILTEPLSDMEVRVTFLRSKQFPSGAIARIVCDTPKILTIPVKLVDKMLGFLQAEFRLSGAETRSLFSAFPKVLYHSPERIKLNHILMKDGMQLTTPQIAEMLFKFPKLVGHPPHQVKKSFELLHADMELPLELVLHWPNILAVSHVTLHKRHLFLVSLGRDQYDPKKENFVPLHAFGGYSDFRFCKEVAQVPQTVMYEFMKTV